MLGDVPSFYTQLFSFSILCPTSLILNGVLMSVPRPGSHHGPFKDGWSLVKMVNNRPLSLKEMLKYIYIFIYVHCIYIAYTCIAYIYTHACKTTQCAWNKFSSSLMATKLKKLLLNKTENNAQKTWQSRSGSHAGNKANSLTLSRTQICSSSSTWITRANLMNREWSKLLVIPRWRQSRFK